MRSRAVSASIRPQDPTSAGAFDQPSSVPAGMVMLIRAGSGVLRPVWSNGDPGGGPSNPAGRPSSSSSSSCRRPPRRRRLIVQGRGVVFAGVIAVVVEAGVRVDVGPSSSGRRARGRRGRRRRRRRRGFGAGGEAVPGAALVDPVQQDHRPDLGQGAAQAGVAEPDRLGVDRRLPRQRLGRVQLPPRQARRPRVLPAQLDPPVVPRLVLPPLDALGVQAGLEPGRLLLQVRQPHLRRGLGQDLVGLGGEVAGQVQGRVADRPGRGRGR